MQLRLPEYLNGNGMKAGYRLAGHIVLVTLAGALAGTCREPMGDAVHPEDLYGTWNGETLAGGAYLVFKAAEDVNRFELRAAPGEFSAVLDSGENLLSMGYFGLTGTFISLIDDGAAAYACPGSITDRFDIRMNSAGDAMQLDHIGDECTARAQLLTSPTWMRQMEE